jgi:hypothetical protein
VKQLASSVPSGLLYLRVCVNDVRREGELLCEMKSI